MFSIIVPIYNCENYLERCIDSILSQDNQNFELILVDDGSADESAHIIDKFSVIDSRVRVFHLENGGPSTARNFGIEKAKGEWILFVDADDFIDDSLLSHLNVGNESADIIFFGFKRCYENAIEVCTPKKRIYSTDQCIINETLTELVCRKDELFGYSVNKIFKKSIIDQFEIRFPEKLKIREDEIFALKYCCHITSIEVIDFAPYNYRILSNSLSHNNITKYRNYFQLAEIESALINDLANSVFKKSFYNKIYRYFILAIIENIKPKNDNINDIIDKTYNFYNKHKKDIIIPKWQSLIFNLKDKKKRQIIIKIVFLFRSWLK